MVLSGIGRALMGAGRAVVGGISRVGRTLGGIARGAVGLAGRALGGIQRGLQVARSLPVVGGIVNTALSSPLGMKLQAGLATAGAVQRGASQLIGGVDAVRSGIRQARRGDIAGGLATGLRGGEQAFQSTQDIRSALRRQR